MNGTRDNGDTRTSETDSVESKASLDQPAWKTHRCRNCGTRSYWTLRMNAKKSPFETDKLKIAPRILICKSCGLFEFYAEADDLEKMNG